jgi:two-component system chemotaxis response regulator CheB
VNTPAGEEVKHPMAEEMEIEVKIAKEEHALESGILKWGTPSIYACPECHGVLLQLHEGSRTRFRCHTGHAYSVDSLLAEFTIKTEESLWSAIRALEENVILLKGLAGHVAGHHTHPESITHSESLLKKADEAQERANLVRQALAPIEPHALENPADVTHK